MTTPTRFEDRLLEQLRHVVAANPSPAPAVATGARRHSRGTRFALAGGGLAAATAVVAIVASSGSHPQAAYAVEPRPDGTVSVTIKSLSDASGLQSALRAKGVPADVDYTPASGGPVTCPDAPPAKSLKGKPPEAGVSSVHLDSGAAHAAGPTLQTQGTPPPPGSPAARGATSGSVRHNPDGSTTFGIDPGHLEPGQRVHISTSDGKMDSVGVSIGQPGQPAPACFATGGGPHG